MLIKIAIFGIFFLNPGIAQTPAINISEELVASIFDLKPFLPTEEINDNSTNVPLINALSTSTDVPSINAPSTNDSLFRNLNSQSNLNIKQNPNIIPEAAVNYTGCPLESGKVCVPVYLCKENDIVITDGSGLFDVRFDADIPQECPTLEICCSLDNRVNETIVTTKETTPEGCGYRNPNGIGFKITESSEGESQYGEFPWMVAILLEERTGNQILHIYKCGGSLIHPFVVLTAAHCVINVRNSPKNLLVRAGEWNSQTEVELFPHQDRIVSEIVIHERFYLGGLFNNIALLFVNRAFDLAENVRTICLPPGNIDFDYARCYATGWGKDTFGQSGKYQVILKKLDLPIVPRRQCQTELRKTRLGNYFQLHESFLCAGGEVGKDTCKGDGGSPLVCPIQANSERYAQAGIVAWGIGCGDPIPAVYVNVPYLRPWIDEQLFSRIKGLFLFHYTP